MDTFPKMEKSLIAQKVVWLQRQAEACLRVAQRTRSGKLAAVMFQLATEFQRKAEELEQDRP